MNQRPTSTPPAPSAEWLKRTQESLALRSCRGLTFNRLYDLLRDRRLVRYALDRVLRNEGAKTAGMDGQTKT
jgi:hypothetical protein